MKKLPTDATTIVVGAAVALGGYLLLKREAAAAVDKVTTAVDPTSRDNLAYTGVNKVGRALSGDRFWTFGGWLYDLTHDDPLRTPEGNAGVQQVDVKARTGTNGGMAYLTNPTPAPTWWPTTQPVDSPIFPSGGA